jgi:gas vesicle protein
MEPDNTRDDNSSRLAWFLTGAIIGATVAILYAPKSGKDTRQLISDTTRKGKDAIAESSQDIVEAGKEMYDRGRKLVEDAAALFDRGRKLVQG